MDGQERREREDKDAIDREIVEEMTKTIYDVSNRPERPEENSQERPVRINSAYVEIDAMPLSENAKMVMLGKAFMPMLYAFDGAAVTLSIELTSTKH